MNQSQSDSFGSHNHRATSTVTDPGHKHTQHSLNDDFNSTGSYGNVYIVPSFAQSDSAGNITWTNNIDMNGTGITVSTTIDLCGNSVETRPYNYGINWIIKYF